MKASKFLIITGVTCALLTPTFLSSLKDDNYEIANALETKELSNILPESFECSYSFNKYYDNYFFDIPLTEKIFNNTGYLNDHHAEFKDAGGNELPLLNGILINGETFSYWINDSGSLYPRNDKLHAYPLTAGATFNPVAIEMQNTKMCFKVNAEYFPMDSIEVTFKAGIFKGYYNSVNFELSEDVTYYSTLNKKTTTKFVRQKNEVIGNGKIVAIDKWGETTASHGGKYQRYVLRTNIPRDTNVVKMSCPVDNFRYLIDNVMINNRSVASINAWARGNSKDFTNLSDATTQNTAYEVGHPTGSVNVDYDFAVRIEIATDTPNFVMILSVPNQLVTDLSLGTLTFDLRDGSAWQSVDGEGNQIVVRLNKALFAELIADACDELDNYVDFSLYRQAERNQILNIISVAEANIDSAVTAIQIEALVEQTKQSIDAFKTDEELTKEERINNVVTLIANIPAEITNTEECINKVNAALEAYINLTASEKAEIDSEDISKLYEACATLDALNLANYKALALTEIATNVNPNLYRENEKAIVNSLLETATTSINNATSKEEVEEALNNLYLAVANISTDVDLTKLEIAALKANANNELDAIDTDAYRAEQKAQVEEIISNGKNLINLASSGEEIQTLLIRIKTVIASIKTDAELTVEEEALKALSSAKASALNEINNKYDELKDGNYSEENKAYLSSIKDRAIEKINNATSVEEVNNAKEAGIAALSNVSREDNNQKKCGGNIITTSILLSSVSLFGILAIFSKKRKED